MAGAADALASAGARIRAAATRAGRDPSEVRLIAVSKNRPLEQTLALHAAGHRVFAENRVQELRGKVSALPPDAEWHLIGRLQTNKAKMLPGLITWVHSVDRLDVIEALEKAFAKAESRVSVLIQVNIAGEEQKAGCAPQDTLGLVTAACQCAHLNVEGLMTMAPWTDDEEVIRAAFRGLAQLRGQLRGQTGSELTHLSMGMSNDFEIAVEEGATMVRVGSALYEGWT